MENSIKSSRRGRRHWEVKCRAGALLVEKGSPCNGREERLGPVVWFCFAAFAAASRRAMVRSCGRSGSGGRWALHEKI
jgi:hypothetical protein